MVCFIAVALTLPVESILLRAVSNQDVQQVARQWAAQLSVSQADGAANQIQSYPFAYRREIMRVLPPARRASVWRNHIVRYVGANPGLSDSVKALLYNAASLATPSEFTTPTDDGRNALAIIAEQTKVLLGKDAADYLFYRLGPADGTFASAEPLGQKLATYVRNIFVVEARDEDCDCAMSFGCDAPSHCSTAMSCNTVNQWPMCGWWWNSPCDGLCMAGLQGGD